MSDAPALASDSVAEQLSAIVHRQEHHAGWVKAFRAAADRADREAADLYIGGADS